MTMERELILVRYGEIFLKGQNRPYFMRALVRNAFMGDAPYVYGTPEHAALMGVFGRLRPVLGNVKKNGQDLVEMLEKTMGKVGLSDNDARFTLV